MLRRALPKKRRDWPSLAVDIPELVQRWLKQTCIDYYRLARGGDAPQPASALTPRNQDAKGYIAQVASIVDWPPEYLDSDSLNSDLHIEILTSPPTSVSSSPSVALSGDPELDCDAVQSISLYCLFTWSNVVDIIAYDTVVMGCALVRVDWPPDFVSAWWTVPSTNLFTGCRASWASNPIGFYRLDSFAALVRQVGPVSIYHPDTPLHDDVTGFLL